MMPTCLCNLQLAVFIADREGAEMFVQLAACSFSCGQGGCRDVCATCSLQFRLRVFTDSDDAEMFVQLAACNFDCGQWGCRDVCTTCSFQFWLWKFADNEGANMFVQLAACSFDCGSLRTMRVPPVLDTTVVGGRRLQQSRCRINEWTKWIKEKRKKGKKKRRKKKEKNKVASERLHTNTASTAEIAYTNSRLAWEYTQAAENPPQVHSQNEWKVLNTRCRIMHVHSARCSRTLNTEIKKWNENVSLTKQLPTGNLPN